jgi:hypothetical protein
MHISRTRRAAVTVAMGALALGATACSDDDDAGAPDEFCQAELDVEAAVSTEDADALAPAFEALGAAAPEEITGAVETAIAEAQVFLADDGEPTPEFEAAYGEMMEFVKDGCGFGDMSVVAKEYSFGGIDPEYDAGPLVITLENDGEEFHELAVMRVNDDVTETAEELLALPQEEAESKVTNVAGSFAAPGGVGYGAVELTPGRYIVACFVPEGMTPEALEEMEATGTEPDGQPHAMAGMVAEFEVK